MNKWLELLIGLVFVVVAILPFAVGNAYWGFGPAALTVLKGGIVWGVLMMGLLFILLGISDLKE